MKKTIFIVLSITIFFFLGMTSCQIKKESIKSNRADFEKIEKVELDFEILSDEISLNEINEINTFREKIIAYSDFEILATLKQINKTDEIIKLDNFIINEHFEITTIKKEPKDDFIAQYDYHIIFDPETYETIGIRDITLRPNEASIDSINLVNDFRFYLSGPDTLLLRIKKQYFGKEIYSNWDTLIIK